MIFIEICMKVMATLPWLNNSVLGSLTLILKNVLFLKYSLLKCRVQMQIS